MLDKVKYFIKTILLLVVTLLVTSYVFAQSPAVALNTISAPVEPTTPRQTLTHELRPNHIQPGPLRMTLWFMPSGSQSANTGQLTCHAWARSINVAIAMERFGPFHGAVAPLPFIEDFGTKQLLNNTAHVFLGPLASKWDIPIWSTGSPDDPRPTLSGIYRAAKNITGPTSIVVVWDPPWLVPVQHAWLDGLTQAGYIDAVQALGWKQRIGPWRTSEPNRVDRMDFDIQQGKIRNFKWRSITINPSTQLHGCTR